MSGRETVGFVGAGAMGLPMVKCLIKAGYSVVVRDPNPAATEPLKPIAQIAGSIAEVCSMADVLVACLPTLSAYESLVVGDDPIRAGAKLKLYIHVGTTGPASVQMIGEYLETLGIATLDAPITGGMPRAIEGRLTAIVSGHAAALKCAHPIMSSYADNIFHVGEGLGGGQIIKLINNVMSVSNLAIASEALLLGVRAGLDVDLMLKVLTTGTGKSDALDNKISTQVVTGKFAQGGALYITQKDLHAFTDAANELSVATPLIDSIRDIFDLAASVGSPADDVTTVIRHMEQRAGVTLRSSSSLPHEPGQP